MQKVVKAKKEKRSGSESSDSNSKSESEKNLIVHESASNENNDQNEEQKYPQKTVNSGIKIKGSDSQNKDSESETWLNSDQVNSNATPIAFGNMAGDASEVRVDSQKASSEDSNEEGNSLPVKPTGQGIPYIEILCILIIVGLGVCANYLLKYYTK